MTAAPPDSFDRVAVVGAGRMGHGIAAWFAAEGREVTLYDADPDVLAASEDRVDAALETLRAAGRVTDADRAAARIERDESLATTVADADFVTEAVVEDVGVKGDVFETVAEHAPTDAVLATNTSGLSVTTISESVPNPERVVGTHWFNPPYVVPLVEVVEGEHTSAAVVEATYDLFEAVGKTPVHVEKDVPGFIGNRIQTAMAYEAFSLLDSGVASPEAIDRAVKAGFGFRLPFLGIFEKADQSGLEIHEAVEQNLLPELDRGEEPKPVLTDLVEAGHTGVESGQGVYDWSDADPEEVFRERDEALLSMLELYEE